MQLTRAGLELFALTQRLFAISGDIEMLLQAGARAEPALIRLGSDSPIYAARMTSGLRARHAELTIQVRIGNARETLDWLREAQVDVAIVSDPPGDNHYAYQPLFADRFMVAIPADHPMADCDVFPMAALAGVRLLMREPTSRTRIATEELLAAAEIAPAEIIELHTRETIREGVALGLGLSLFISSECPPDDRIVYVPLESAGDRHAFAGYVVCLTERRRTRIMQSVMAMAEEMRSLSPVPLIVAGANKAERRARAN